MRDLVYLLKLCTNLPLLLVYAGIVLEEEDQPEPTESGAFHLGMASHVATKMGERGRGEKIDRERDRERQRETERDKERERRCLYTHVQP